MPGYWWACDNRACQNRQSQLSFRNTLRGVGIVAFLWDQLSHNWDQSLLTRNCPACGGESLRITYDFRRREPERIRVVHIVALRREGDPFLQMMWEGIPHSGQGQHWFDFKYMNGRNARGLNRPCIFEQQQLREIFALYCEKTGRPQFP